MTSRTESPGVISSCCGALILEFRIAGVRWFECQTCGAVI